MSSGQSYIEYLRQLKTGKQQMICYLKKNRELRSTDNTPFNNTSSCKRTYSAIMKRQEFCSIDENYSFMLKTIDDSNTDKCECQTRDDYIFSDNEIENTDEHLLLNKQQSLISCT